MKKLQPPTPARPPSLSRNETLMTQNLVDNMLLGSLEVADQVDDVVLTITKFTDVLDTKKRSAGKIFSRMCEHKVSLNGKPPVRSDNPILESDFKKTIPKTVKITVIDGETPPNNPPYIYYPIGIAFKNGRHPKKVKSALNPEDFKNGKVYLFGQVMYLTISKDFKFEHLSKYAVIVQRNDTKIGVIDPPVINEC
jgi:hypothetical protein